MRVRGEARREEKRGEVGREGGVRGVKEGGRRRWKGTKVK